MISKYDNKLEKSRLLEEKQAKMEKQLEVDRLKMAEEQRRFLMHQETKADAFFSDWRRRSSPWRRRD